MNAAPKSLSPVTASVLCLPLTGIVPRAVRVEVTATPGEPNLALHGFPEATARESRIRVRASLVHVGVAVDGYALSVKLVPHDVGPFGGVFDLAIAVGIVAALGGVPADALAGTALLGELSLSGTIKHVRGVQPALRAAAALGVTRAFVPLSNAAEAAHVLGVNVRAADHVADVIAHLCGERLLPRLRAATVDLAQRQSDVIDMAGVLDPVAHRAIEVAAAGGHNLLFIGPPGSDPIKAARRLITILPPLTPEEAVDLTALYSVAYVLPASGLVSERPFRAPHHTVSTAALVGGGEPVRPGEVSLGHAGCLFLDQLHEFRRGTLEALRNPLRDGQSTVTRFRSLTTFPSKPHLVASTYPCPCGYGKASGVCSCSAERVADHLDRLKGPLLDRTDMRVRLRFQTVSDLQTAAPADSSAVVQARVVNARNRQEERRRRSSSVGNGGSGVLGAALNAHLTTDDLKVAWNKWLTDSAVVVVARAFPVRGPETDRVLRIARTIADLDSSGDIDANHVAEAITLQQGCTLAEGSAAKA